MLLLMALKNSITDTNTQNVTKKKIEQLLFNITAQPNIDRIIDKLVNDG